MTSQDTNPRKRSAARFAVIGGIALLIIADCLSVFSMLVWDPPGVHAATAAPAIVSSHSE
jgi:hypothetical protein